MFIDIHNHCAWDIDDGMPSKEDAVASLKEAYGDGIKEIIATPHFIPGSHDDEAVMEINERIKELKELACEIGIKVHQGSEIFLNDHYLEMLDSDTFNTLADSGYALCEFDVRRDITKNEQANDMLYEFTIRNMIPVIAHAERYFPNGIDMKLIKEWFDNGYVIQINRTSLLGMHGEITKKNAWKILYAGYAHVVASDAHRANGHRICKLSDAYELLEKELGTDNAKLLCYQNPKHLIENEEIEDMKIEKKKSWLDKLKRR